MSAISERLRDRRTRWVRASGAVEFLVARPRALELVRWSERGNAEVALRSVIDWRGVTLGDVMGDGDASPQGFDADLRDEWLPDRPDLLIPVWDAVQAMLSEHAAQREADRKN